MHRISLNMNVPPLTFKDPAASDDDEPSIYGPGEWQTNGRILYEVKHLDVAVQIAKNMGLYSLVFVKIDEIMSFFKYQAKLVEFHRLAIGVQIGQITRQQGLESVRAVLVKAMQAGERLCIMIDKIAPDFIEKYTDAHIFPSEKIFDFKEFRKIETYKSLLLEEEDYDLQGNKGNYLMQDDFTIVILSAVQSEEEKQEVINRIPGCKNNFQIIEIK